MEWALAATRYIDQAMHWSGLSDGLGAVRPANAPDWYQRGFSAATSGTRRIGRAMCREGINAGHVCDGVGSRHSSQAGSDGRREKDEKLTLHMTPNSFTCEAAYAHH